MRTTRRRSLVIGLTIIALAAFAAPTAAAQLVREHYSGTDSGTWECGDLTGLEFEGQFEGLFTIKPGHNGSPPFLTDNYHWQWLNTNPANGKWFREEGQGQYKDLRMTNLGGTVFRFVAQESGSPYTITTSDGRKIVMDRGLLRYTFVVDTLGDDDLDNDVFVEGSDELIADHGSHPGWHFTSDDYCDLVEQLLG